MIAGFADAFSSSDDGFIDADTVSHLIEQFLSGFHSYGYDLCYRNNSEAVGDFMPIERLFKLLSLVQYLNFESLWEALASIPVLDCSDVGEICW